MLPWEELRRIGEFIGQWQLEPLAAKKCLAQLAPARRCRGDMSGPMGGASRCLFVLLGGGPVG